MWMSAYERVYMNEVFIKMYCIRMSHVAVAYEWVMSLLHMSEPCRKQRSRVTYEQAKSHLWMSRVTHMYEACHMYEWAMSPTKETRHVWMSHVANRGTTSRHIWTSSVANTKVTSHINESCHSEKWVMSHIWMGHVTHMNGSCHTYKWVMSHIRASPVAYEWVMSRIWMRHVTCIVSTSRHVAAEVFWNRQSQGTGFVLHVR